MTPSKIYGLIGNPIKHSLSPFMHNAAFQTLGIAAHYRLFELLEPELELFIKGIRQKNIAGLNVTIPYKEKVISYLDDISDEARMIGAVNTVKVNEQRLQGYNTDGLGFLKHLTDELAFDPQGKRVSVIGAGGASKAITVSLSIANVAAIKIYDVDQEKLQLLIGHLKKHFPHIDFQAVESMKALTIKEADLLINATPIGMQAHDPCLVSDDMLQKDLFVYDVIYNPAQTKLLKKAAKRGARVSNGLGMLLYQGMAAFTIWTGLDAPKAVMKEALLRAQSE